MPIDRSSPILQTEALTKQYGTHVALDHLDLTVHRGEVFGYIGPNGAGKTTTFRILAGLLDPSSGRAMIAGKDVTGDKDAIKQVVGYLPDNFGVYPTLRVWEYLDFFAAAYRIPKKARQDRIDFCLEIANAAEFRDKLMGALSRGMKPGALSKLPSRLASWPPSCRRQIRRRRRSTKSSSRSRLVVPSC